MSASAAILFRKKIAAAQGLNSQHVKIVGGNWKPLNPLGFTPRPKVVTLHSVTGEKSECRTALLQEVQFLMGNVLFIGAAR